MLKNRKNYKKWIKVLLSGVGALVMFVAILGLMTAVGAFYNWAQSAPIFQLVLIIAFTVTVVTMCFKFMYEFFK